MPSLVENNHYNLPFLQAGVSAASSVMLDESPLHRAEFALMENEDEQFYTRCRRAILRLNDQLVKAAAERSDFAPFLLEAMRNAMAQLLEHGDERDLILLEQWLDEENELQTA